MLMLSLFSWLILGPVLSVAYSGIADPSSFLYSYIRIHIPFIVLFLALWMLSESLMGKGLLGIAGITGPRDIAIPFAAQIAVLAAFSMLEWKDIAFDAFLPLQVIPVIAITSIQAFSEEIVFRALPMRIAYGEELPRDIRHSAVPVAASGAVFLIAHLRNQEIALSSDALFPIIYYAFWGASAMALSIRTGSFASSVAMHAANNIYIALAVNYKGSTMPTHALFLSLRSQSDILLLAKAAVSFITVYLVSRRTTCSR